MDGSGYGSRCAVVFWCLLGFLSCLLDKPDVTVLAFLPRDHRSLRNNVGDRDIKAGRILLVTLPPGLPGMSAYPTVARLIDLNHVTTFSTTQRGVMTRCDLFAQLLV